MEKKQELEEHAPISDVQDDCKNKTVVLVGDIHGCFDEFMNLLDMIGWDSAKHIMIHTGDLVDSGPIINVVLEFAMDSANRMCTLMSNNLLKLHQYLRRRWPIHLSLVEKIHQLGHLATESYFVKWLKSLLHIKKWLDHSYAIHPYIIAVSPANKPTKSTCTYIQSCDRSTTKIFKERKITDTFVESAGKIKWE